MKRHIWRAALSCGLALCLSSTQAKTSFAFDGRAARDGGVPHTQSSGGQSHSVQSSAGAGIRGKGGIHAPSMTAPRNKGGRGGQIAGRNRSPSFSHPVTSASGGHNTRLPADIHNLRERDGGIAGATRPAPSFRGRDAIHDAGIGGSELHDQLAGNARISNRPFLGNSINLNNRLFSVGNSGYQPSHYRHNGYHGYWNGNRRISSGNNIVSAIAYGLGSSFGNGNAGNYNGYNNNYSGYNNGWGWGLGNGFRGNNGFGSYSGYGYRPLGWGLGGWGLGSLIYNSGYLGYSNPYYVNSGATVYNYTQPIPVSYNTPVVINSSDSQSPEAFLNNAVYAFQQNDYDQALDITNKGIAQYPDDAVLHEFRSLVLFANQDYQQSAATIHSVLAIGPGWDWTTMSSMYLNTGIYTPQLRALEAFTKSNPQDAASQFLLAYHYMTCGHPDAAARHLQQVTTLMPNDRVALDLLRMILPPTPLSATNLTPATSPPPGNSPSSPPRNSIDPKSLIGVWSSTRENGSQFSLQMTDDAKFAWSFTPKDQATQEFGGTYTVEQNVLVLERTDGGSLIAEVTHQDSQHFNFRLIGASDDDKGLKFTK